MSAKERYVTENAACKGSRWHQEALQYEWGATANTRRHDSSVRQAPCFQMAKSICETCPVVNECREVCDELEGGDTLLDRSTRPVYLTGVWGAETPSERASRRRRLLERRRRAA